MWVELVPVCGLDVVAAATACCSYCDNENLPPTNKARAIRRKLRRAVSAQLPAGRQTGWYMYLLAAWCSLIARAVRGRFQQTRDLRNRASMDKCVGRVSSPQSASGCSPGAAVDFVVCFGWGGIHFPIRRSRAVSVDSGKGQRQSVNLPTKN